MAIIPSMSGRFKPGPVFYSEMFRLSYNTPVWYDIILSYDKQGKPYIRTGRNESLGKTSSYPEYKDAESCARIFIGSTLTCNNCKSCSVSTGPLRE